MKRYIRNSEGYKGFKDKNDHVKNTRRDEIQFDNEEVWSIQFYGNQAQLIDDAEVYVMAHNYAEAKQQANFLCRAWDYDPDACVIQYAFESIEWWNRHPIKLEGWVEYIEE